MKCTQLFRNPKQLGYLFLINTKMDTAFYILFRVTEGFLSLPHSAQYFLKNNLRYSEEIYGTIYQKV